VSRSLPDHLFNLSDNCQLARDSSIAVFATARNPSGSQGLQKLASENPSRLHLFRADVTNSDSIKALAVDIKKKTNSLDLVIYNAGVLASVGNILDVGVEGLKANLDTNLYVFPAQELVVVRMQSRPVGGSIAYEPAALHLFAQLVHP